MKKLIGMALFCASVQASAAESANESTNVSVKPSNYPECTQSTNADCRAYVESLVAKAENNTNVGANRRDFGDCRDDWSCDKEDLKNYLGKNRGDVIGRPAPTPVPEPNTAMIFLLGASMLIGGRALKRKTQH